MKAYEELMTKFKNRLLGHGKEIFLTTRKPKCNIHLSAVLRGKSNHDYGWGRGRANWMEL